VQLENLALRNRKGLDCNEKNFDYWGNLSYR